MTSGPLQSVRAVTFDMYGTLLDLEATFREPFGRFLSAKGSSKTVSEVVHLWEASYLRESMVDTMLGRGRTPFDRLRRHHLGQVFSQLGVENVPDEIECLLADAAGFSLFPDVVGGLQALQGRFTLAALSNGDLATLERAVSSLGLPMDRVISAEQVGVYKPHAAVYQMAAENLNLRPEQILHVASHVWDVRAAKVWGMLGAYVNRHGIPYHEDVPPDLEVVDLKGLAEGLGA